LIVASKDLLFFKNNTALKPLQKISTQTIKAIVSSPESNIEFRLLLVNGNNVYFKVEDKETRDNWIKTIELFRRQNSDI